FRQIQLHTVAESRHRVGGHRDPGAAPEVARVELKVGQPWAAALEVDGYPLQAPDLAVDGLYGLAPMQRDASTGDPVAGRHEVPVAGVLLDGLHAVALRPQVVWHRAVHDFL